VAIDDFPPDALEKQFQMEDSSVSPVSRVLLKLLSHLVPVVKSKLPAPYGEILNRFITWLRERNSADSSVRIQLMVTTLRDEMRKMDRALRALIDQLSPDQLDARVRTAFDLFLDGARKAEQTRSEDRVKHIAIILGNATVSTQPINADDVEEQMRVAMDVGDTDLKYLRELVRITGQTVADQGRITRENAYRQWEYGFWGTRIDPEIDSVFSKLESYGLVSRIPPPNNLNISADFQNRYALLPKGLRFFESITSRPDPN
jgi:hypothetical protein